jgi:hypothetical protein
VGLEKMFELVAQAGEHAELVVHLVQPSTQEGVGVAAGALAAVHYLEQLGDVIQAQADVLSASDESEPVDGRRVVEPIPAVASCSAGEKPHALVIANRVGRNACRVCDVGYRQEAHENTVSL